jgi:hypothetical protein
LSKKAHTDYTDGDEISTKVAVHEKIDPTMIYVLLIILFSVMSITFLYKCAYDYNNRQLMMNLPESERKVYAAIISIEREQDERFERFQKL